ncbi:MAG TPA: hypothetical protein VGI70_19355, partial [Polyangiales bacterium]
ALVAVVALSVPAFKAPRYVLAVVPFLYMFAGVCLAAFVRSPDKLRPATSSVVRFSMLVALLAFASVVIVYALRGPVTGWYLAAHAFGTLLCLALGELWLRTRFVTRELAGLAIAGLAGFAIVYPRVTAPPPYAAIAAALGPHLTEAPSAYPSFVAHDCDVLQGYLDRAGARLDEVGGSDAATHDDTLKAFVIGPSDLRVPDVRSLLGWLTGHSQEIGAFSDRGRGERYRVFVR